MTRSCTCVHRYFCSRNNQHATHEAAIASNPKIQGERQSQMLKFDGLEFAALPQTSWHLVSWLLVSILDCFPCTVASCWSKKPNTNVLYLVSTLRQLAQTSEAGRSASMRSMGDILDIFCPPFSEVSSLLRNIVKSGVYLVYRSTSISG